RPPFQGDTLLDTLLLRLTEDPQPPRHYTPDVPRDLEAICLRCLERDPARRYPTAAELAADLGRFLDDEPIETTPSGLANRLLGARGRVQLQARLAGFGNLLLALAPLMFLGELWVQWVLLTGVGTNWALAGRWVQAGLFVLLVACFRRGDLQPRGVAERQ